MYDNELAHLQSISYILAIQEFLKNKKINYLLYDSWYNILNCEKELISNRKSKSKNKFFNFDTFYFHELHSIEENQQKGPYYTNELNIGKMIEKIDLNYYLKPADDSIKIQRKTDTGHPNYEDCINMKNRLLRYIK